MSIALWCVLVVGLLPYPLVIIAKSSAQFDNNNPRDWLAKLEGYRRRANAAHANALEAFPLFAAAVIVATLRAAPQHHIDVLAVVFVAARVLHAILYLADWATLRSIVWLLGVVCAITIFVA